MPVSLSYSVLMKTMLMSVVISICSANACAEDFGVSRRTPAQVQQPTGQPQILPYVVRIIAFDSSGQSFGTGSYVGTYGEYGIVLTNQHVVSETSDNRVAHVHNRLVHVHFPSGFSSFGAIVRTDDLWDLALLVISKPPPSIPTLPIAQTPSKPGDTLWIAGFGSGLYRIAEGRCVRYLAPENPKDGSPPLYEIMEVSVSARKGDSGGPILNQKGELAGVLFGSDMIRNTAGSHCDRVSRFLIEAQNGMARLPVRPETYFASIETEGPLQSLRETRNAVPQNANAAVLQRMDYTVPSAPSTRGYFSAPTHSGASRSL